MTQPTSLCSLRDSARQSLRRTLEQSATARSPAAALLRTALEWWGHVPGIGPVCRRGAGFLHARGGDPFRAIELYRAAIAGGTASAPLHYELGESLMAVGSFAEAEIEFRRATRLAPGAAWIIGGLASAVASQGRAVSVVSDLLEAARTLPDDDARQLAFPSYLGPQVLEAPVVAAELESFVANHPDAEHATVLLAQVEALRGNATRATSLSRAAAAVHFRSYEDSLAPAAAPRFLILGQAKAGTSALFEYLSAHPAMVPPLVKEPHYWSSRYALGPQWYRSQFPRLAGESGLFTGEGSTTYLTDAHAPARVAQDIPDVRLIVLLRDPVARAYSEYWRHRQLGRHLPPFEEVVAGEMKRLPDCPLDDRTLWDDGWPSGHLAHSAALPFLKRWLKHVSPRQLLVLRSGQMARDLPGTMERVCRFLGVPVHVPPDARRHNEGRYPPLSPQVESTLRAWFEPHQRALENFLTHLPQAMP